MSKTQDFDQSALRMIFRIGGERLVRRLIDLFCENALKLVNDARVGEQAADLEVVERAMHSLKSTAGQLGAVRLRRLAEEIERLAQNQDADVVSTRFHALEAALEQARVYMGEQRRGR